jgi:hypothetical protein
MSLTKNRAATTERTDFMADERAFLVAWGNENGLDVSIKPAVADLAHEMVFVSYEEHIASWVIYRADGYLWLCRIEDRVGHGREGSKMVVDSVEEALATIIVDTEG